MVPSAGPNTHTQEVKPLTTTWSYIHILLQPLYACCIHVCMLNLFCRLWLHAPCTLDSTLTHSLSSPPACQLRSCMHGYMLCFSQHSNMLCSSQPVSIQLKALFLSFKQQADVVCCMAVREQVPLLLQQ